MEKDVDAALYEPISNLDIRITAPHDLGVWVFNPLHVVESKFCNRTERTPCDTGDHRAAYKT